MTFPVHFLLSNVFISLLLGFITLVKKVLKKHLTLKAQHHLWYIFVFALFLPFSPHRIFTPGKIFLQMQQWLSHTSRQPASVLVGNTPGAPAAPVPGLTDFSTAIASANTAFTTLLWGIWLAGICSVSLFYLCMVLKIFFMQKKANRITRQTEPGLYCQFSACLQELHMKRNVRLYTSCTVLSPVSYGWIRPTVVIPQDLDILLSQEDIRHIFLHELHHCKHRDSIINGLVCLLQIIYWFNPLIWYGFRQLQKDREIACDHAVIAVIGREKGRDYGYTLLRYAEHVQRGRFFSPLSTLGGGKDMIRQRITEIANYKSDTVLQKTKSAGALLFVLLLVYCSSPLLTARASHTSGFPIKDGNWEALDAAAFFDGTEGSFVLYDKANAQYRIYNREFSERQASPDSTFKIYSGLFALEEGVITPDSSLQKWDGAAHVFDSWNQDQTLATAMGDSVNWYFQNLDSRLGLPTLYSYYSKISYGNCNLTGGVSQYWAESSLKISPVEQVMLLSGLLDNKWDFHEQNIQAIKNALFIADTPAGKLYGKTGTGSVDGQDVNGWFVGFIENSKNVYCFALHLHGSENCTGRRASKIAMEILNEVL